jgi:type IV pilus assembly protein PilM
MIEQRRRVRRLRPELEAALRDGVAMIEHRWRTRRSLVCLDFGRDRVSAVELVEGVVARWTSWPLAEDALRNGDPTRPAALATSVRLALAGAGIEARKARMALPDEATVSRHLVLPAMPQRDLARAMHFAAERHLPFPIERARWSWDVVRRTPAQVTLYLVATWRDVIDHYVEVARGAGLVPQALEPRSLAVARAVDQQEALLVDAGGRRLHATLLVDGQPAFVDDVVTAGTVGGRREALDRLLQRAYRYQSTAAAQAGRLAPVLLAGDLEREELELAVAGRPVSEVLNGQLPLSPNGFRPAEYLANLGLAMRTRR